MRALVAIAMIALGIASLTEASADNVRVRFDLNVRAAPLVIYDYQPGVYVRAYWRAPWGNRHYYPSTGETPEIGRYEDPAATSGRAPEPAESFHRAWSTSSAASAPADYVPEYPRDRVEPYEADRDPHAGNSPKYFDPVKP